MLQIPLPDNEYNRKGGVAYCGSVIIPTAASFILTYTHTDRHSNNNLDAVSLNYKEHMHNILPLIHIHKHTAITGKVSTTYTIITPRNKTFNHNHVLLPTHKPPPLDSHNNSTE